MKYLLKAIVLFVLAQPVSSLTAQSSGVDRYYQDIRNDERFTSVSVSSKMFSLFVNFEMEDPAEQQLVETISKLKGLKVLIGNEIPEAKSIYTNIVGNPASEMEELMDVTDASRQFKFFITEAGGSISELLMVGYEKSQVVILSLVGDIDLKEISALSQKMDIKGFKHLENLNNQ